MSTKDSARSRETEADRSADSQIKELYQNNARQVDAHDFMHGLRDRLEVDRRRAKRRSLIRSAGFALAGLVVAAALGIGVWQGLQHLTTPHEVLVIGDSETPTSYQGETTTTVTGVASTSGQLLASVGLTHVESNEPRSVTKLKLADVWAKEAIGLGFNPTTARLESIQVSWGGDGLLVHFDVSAATPDSRVIEVSASPGLEAPSTDGRGATPTESITFTGDARPAVDSGDARMTLGTEGDSSFVSVARLLACLDDAGLMEIGTQSGLQVVGDPGELWKDSGQGSIDSSAATGPFGPKGVPDSVSWRLSDSFWPSSFLGPNDLGVYLNATPRPVILHASQGRVARLDGSRVDPSYFPAFGLALGREWSATWESGAGSSSGENEAFVLFSDLPTEQAGSVESHPVDAQLDGLAFAAPPNGAVCLIKDGTTRTIWEPDSRYGHAWGSYGVSYSLRGTMLLFGAAISTVTLEGSNAPFEVYAGIAQSGSSEQTGGDGGGATWKATRNGDAVVFESPIGAAKPVELLRTQALPLMNRLRYDEANDRVWIAKSTGGYTTLQTAQPHTAGFDRILDGIDGDFAVSPDGSTIVYIGPSQIPAKIILRTPAAETDLDLGLAAAHSPVYSPDGSKICLVGSRDVNGDTALWLLDADGGNCTEIAATRGLTPTYPVFSPDGQRIAFRNWTLGDIWTIDVHGGELTRYALNAADAPFAW